MRVVTGCSRSGTSFVCQFLSALGADFGGDDELIEADEWNRRGYFENKAVNTLNHRLLFSDWSEPKLWVDVMWPRDWRVRVRKLATLGLAPLLTRKSQLAERGRRLAEQIDVLSEANRGRCVKDPRFCYLMEPWMRHGNIDSALFVVRHPREAAGSISRQTGLPLYLTYRSWLDSVRRFWDRLPEIEVHVVDYNAFFDVGSRGDAARPLFDFLGLKFDGSMAEAVLARTLDSSLRNRQAPETDLPREIGRRYRELLQSSRR